MPRKQRLKRLANLTASAAVLPAFLLYRMAAALGEREGAFSGWSQAFSLIPGLSGVYLRRAFYRRVLSHCAEDVFLGFGTLLSHPECRIGPGVYIGPYCCLGNVTLEDNVLMASYVSILNGGHQHGTERTNVPVRLQPGQWPRVTIGQDSWVGERSVVMADVGQHCVVGAGAVVTKPVPDYAIVAGVPAKIIGHRDRQEERRR